MAFWLLKRWLFGSQEQLPPPLGNSKYGKLPSSSTDMHFQRLFQSSWSSDQIAGGYQKSIEDISVGTPSMDQNSPRSSVIDSRTISDATIGLADGLTVPFALTAGLSALGNPSVVVYGGLAELFAGAISMGLGGYLGGRYEADAHRSLLQRTSSLVQNNPVKTESLIRDVFLSYALPSDLLDSLGNHITSLPANLQIEFLMHFHHRNSTESADRAVCSAMTIALGYFVGGAIPLLPYVFAVKDDTVYTAFWRSCFVMVIALFTFGVVKTRLLLDKPQQWEENRMLEKKMLGFSKQDLKKCMRGGIEMIVLGGFAAGTAMSVVMTIQVKD